MLQDAIDPAALKRVLVIKLRHHGDVLLTSPVFTVLKQHAPHAELDALVYADTAPMLGGHPAISQVFCIGRQWKRAGWLAQLRHEWALYQALRARQYDLIIHLTDHNRGATLARLLKPRWAIAPAGKSSRRFAKAFTHRYPLVGGNRRHTVELHLDALRRLGLQAPADARQLVLCPSAHARQQVGQRLEALGLLPGQFIHIHPTSRWLFKTWPVAQMAELIDQLTARGWPVLLTAAPDPAELAMLAEIQARLARPVASLAGALSLEQLGALLAQARAFIGMDSVPMHMAAALGTPTVALFGPSGEIEWGPWQVAHRVVREDWPCRPCGRDGCGGGKLSECHSAIPASRVLAALDELLQETGR